MPDRRRLYRVFAHRPRTRPGGPGHATYAPPGQTAGRWDNASAYTIWYTSTTPAGAVGEAFGDIAMWSADMLETPYLPGARRALATFELAREARLCDLDDAATLLDLGIKPSQVVIRDPSVTQPLALRLYREPGLSSRHQFHGLTWWSFHRPEWTNVAVWAPLSNPCPLKLLRTEPLTLDHPALKDAAHALTRPLG
ncbi:MAG: RES domain-containing protein [Micrococcales bacterium]|nr:RES domain-containing protein [Micrococcales bacterium]